MATLQRLWKGPTLVKDKGFAWVVLLMSFLSHTVNIGFSYGVVGNLTIAHQLLFGISLQKSSFVGSIHVGLLCIFGPVSSILVKKLGCRMAQILGGVFMVLAIGLCSLSTQTWHVILLFSVLGGLGISITFTTSEAVLAWHFDRFKYLAFSAAVMGYYAGITFWPIVSQKLLNNFGYSVAMKIMAIPQLAHILAGLFYVQPSNSRIDQSSKRDSNASVEDPDKLSSASPENTNGCDNLAMDSSQIDFEGDKNSATTEGDKQTELKENEPTKELAQTKSVKDEFISFLKSLKIWSLMIHAILWGANITSFFVLVNDVILHKTNSTKDEVAVGVTINGIGNAVGCVAVILVSSLKFDRLAFQFCCVLTYALCTIVVAFSTNKVMFYILSAVWGFANGAFMSNQLAVTYQYSSVDNVAILFGLLLFNEGLGGFIGTSLCSYAAERINPMAALILSGGLGVASCCCILPLIIYECRRRRKDLSDRISASSENES